MDHINWVINSKAGPKDCCLQLLLEEPGFPTHYKPTETTGTQGQTPQSRDRHLQTEQLIFTAP